MSSIAPPKVHEHTREAKGRPTKAEVPNDTVSHHAIGTTWQHIVFTAIQEAHCFARAQQFDNAVLVLSRALDVVERISPLDSDDALLLLKTKCQVLGSRGHVFVSMGNFRAALNDANGLILLNGQWRNGHRLACRALTGLRQWHEAAAACDYVLRIAPHDGTFRNLHWMIMLNLQLNPASPPRPIQPMALNPLIRPSPSSKSYSTTSSTPFSSHAA